ARLRDRRPRAALRIGADLVRGVQRARDDDGDAGRLHGAGRDRGLGDGALGAGVADSGKGALMRLPRAAPLKLAALLLALGLLSIGRALAAPAGGTLLDALARWAPVVFRGFLLNLLVSVLAMAIGTALGLGLGLLLSSVLAPLRGFAWLLTQFFRNAPWLVLLF